MLATGSESENPRPRPTNRSPSEDFRELASAASSSSGASMWASSAIRSQEAAGDRRATRGGHAARPVKEARSGRAYRCRMDGVTAFGVVALTVMMVMYALEKRGRNFILAFAVGCAALSVYGFLAGVWPFGVVEANWCVIVVKRFSQERSQTTNPTPRAKRLRRSSKPATLRRPIPPPSRLPTTRSANRRA